jgi:hypothetical protein
VKREFDTCKEGTSAYPLQGKGRLVVQNSQASLIRRLQRAVRESVPGFLRFNKKVVVAYIHLQCANQHLPRHMHIAYSISKSGFSCARLIFHHSFFI